jgi:cell wall-associated NlpC family hydrolase
MIPADLIDERAQRAVQTALKAVGARWCDYGCNPVTGFDCVGLLLWCYRRAGLLPADYMPPQYCIAGGLLEAQTLELELARLGWRQVNDPGPADAITFRVPRTVWHCGIILDDEHFAHSVRGYGVVVSPIADPTWAGRIAGVWRPPWDS